MFAIRPFRFNGGIGVLLMSTLSVHAQPHVYRLRLRQLTVYPYYDWGQLSITTLVNKLHQEISSEEQIQYIIPHVIDWRNIERYRDNWKM